MDLNTHINTPLTLYNTLSRQQEEFAPVDPDQGVRMYNCGPTVYDHQHIGNLRAYVFADLLRRTLELNGYAVTQVINITDVGHLVSDGDTGQDKMTKGLEREGMPVTLSAMQELGERYAKEFMADLSALNVTEPEHLPRASDFIAEDIALIELLDTKGFTYKTTDGIYFDTSQLDDYGKLAGGVASDEKQQQRVDNNEKCNSRDFALWKFDNKLGWDSPWGQGFPGWHIECSVMSMQHLGNSFDIHTGGIDHIPVHHTNEIAQSEAATGEPMARFWLHNDFIQIADEKISKSIGNTIYLDTIKEQGYSPLAYRYLLLGARYRTKMNFSWEALEAADNALQRLYAFMRTQPERGEVAGDYAKQFTAALNDDLNTPQAIAVIWELLDDDSVSAADKAVTIAAFDTVLGLDLATPPEITIPAEVTELADKREEARQAGDYDEADRLRDQINTAGWQVRDSDDGYTLTPTK